jgi:hypothetical protein
VRARQPDYPAADLTHVNTTDAQRAAAARVVRARCADHDLILDALGLTDLEGA